MCAGALEPTFALALQAHAEYVVAAFAPARDEFRDQFGRILAIAIEHQRGTDGHAIQARGQRSLLAEIAR